MLIDTHAHIHQAAFDGDRYEVLDRAREAGVEKMICVATDALDSQLAVDLAKKHDNLWATVGLHPHEATRRAAAMIEMNDLASNKKVVAIGECGLDYYYEHSPRNDQIKALQGQIELALRVKKPLVFHVRDAFDDFFSTIGEYKNVTGVVHSFTGDEATLNRVLESGLYVAFNGIMTFTKNQNQLMAAKLCPPDRILIETDCPFLTPAPHRGQRNEPANTKIITEFLANLRDESFDELSAVTSQNAKKLFNLK